MSYGPPPPGDYGQPAYGAPLQPPKTSPLAIVSLVLGIVGVSPFCCAYFVVSIAAIVTGFLARRQIAGSGGALKGRGLATAGLVLGIVACVIGVVLWILYAAGVINYNATTRA